MSDQSQGGDLGFQALHASICDVTHRIHIRRDDPKARADCLTTYWLNPLVPAGNPGEIIDEQGIDSALAAYHEAEASDSTFHRHSERDMNELGYDLLSLGMIGEALKSHNVWDSYAEALVAAEKSIVWRTLTRGSSS